MRLFRRKNKKKEIFIVKSIPVDPETMGDPHTAEEYARRGMAFYARQQYERAERDLRAAIALAPGMLDGHYNLGLTLKVAGDSQGSRQAFQQALEVLQSNHLPVEQAQTLTRLVQGQLRLLSGEAEQDGDER